MNLGVVELAFFELVGGQRTVGSHVGHLAFNPVRVQIGWTETNWLWKYEPSGPMTAVRCSWICKHSNTKITFSTVYLL